MYNIREGCDKTLCVHSLNEPAREEFKLRIENRFGTKNMPFTGSFLTETVRVLEGTSNLLIGDRIPFDLYAPGFILTDELKIPKGLVAPQDSWNTPIWVFSSSYEGNKSKPDMVNTSDVGYHWGSVSSPEGNDNTVTVYTNDELHFLFTLTWANNPDRFQEFMNAMKSRILGEQISEFRKAFSVLWKRRLVYIRL